jgi:Fanconi anemia group M protein
MAALMDKLPYDPDVVRMSVQRLVRDDLAVERSGRYVAKASIRAAKTPSKIHTIRVEKIYPGFAVVVVDESFRARLEPSMYNGPREILKKGNTFKATATIRRLNGTTTISIHDIIAIER